MKILILTILMINSTFATEEKALAHIGSFAVKLKKELQNGLKVSPIEAIKVCNTKAPEIQKEVSKDGITIARVSLKNRNPKNYPKPWMLEYINSFHDKKVKKSHIVVDLNNGKKGLLKPIPTMPMCLKCHGDNIPASLNSEIKKLYPKDKAIGYKVGQIRGFFWAEY